MAAVPHDTAPTPNSIWVAPGNYTVRLTANGKALTQPIAVRMDPRVKTSAAGLANQSELSKAMYDGILESQAALRALRDIRAQVKDRQDKLGAAGKPAEGTVPPGGDSPSSRAAQALADFDKKAAELTGGEAAGGRGAAAAGGPPMGPMGFGAPGGPDTLGSVAGTLNQLISLLQAADAEPTTQAVAAIAERREALRVLLAKSNALRTKDLSTLNAALKAAGLPEIKQ
jgi:hypothetical protein